MAGGGAVYSAYSCYGNTGIAGDEGWKILVAADRCEDVLVLRINSLVIRLLQAICLAECVDSEDSQVITLSELWEELPTEFVRVGDFFVVVTRKTAINSLIPAEILRLHPKRGN